MMSLSTSGSTRWDNGVDPARSQKSTVSWRRSASWRGVDTFSGWALVSAAPHCAQNFALTDAGALQDGQTIPSAAPHSVQNIAAGGFWLPQPEQCTMARPDARCCPSGELCG